MHLEMKYFVLKPRGDNVYAQASRVAIRAYAARIAKTDPNMAMGLVLWADEEDKEALCTP